MAKHQYIYYNVRRRERVLARRQCKTGWGYVDMGVIVKEEYVCDYCGQGISDGDVLVGRLSLRKAGARGLGRNFEVALHAGCSDKLVQHAAPVTPKRRGGRKGAEAE